VTVAWHASNHDGCTVHLTCVNFLQCDDVLHISGLITLYCKTGGVASTTHGLCGCTGYERVLWKFIFYSALR